MRCALAESHSLTVAQTNPRLTIGAVAAQSTATPESLGEYGVSAALDWRLPRCSNTSIKGSTIDEFLEWFPSVSREQVHQVLAFAQGSLDQPTAVA